jgi:hypothetical protein
VIPLRGRQQPLGMLQVFSKTPGAFTEDDVRSLDLFAELVLSAIKPEDQDRRVHWLSDVAGELLRTQAAAAEPVAIDPAPVEIADESALETGLATTLTAPIEPEQPEALAVPELATPALPHTNSAALIELLEPAPELADDLFEDQSFEFAETMFAEATLAEPTPDESRPSSSLSLPFLQRLSLAGSSHPGLSVVMGLVAIAALFSAGAWWGMQVHGKAAVTKAPRSKCSGSAIRGHNPACTSCQWSISRGLRQPDESRAVRFRRGFSHRRRRRQIGRASQGHGRAPLVFIRRKHGRHRHGRPGSIRSASFDVARADLLRSA